MNEVSDDINLSQFHLIFQILFFETDSKPIRLETMTSCFIYL